ncbi:hypothetical protein D0N36_06880 [Hymenobacter lapidiphilus]|uniref:hypothetical protein n=1 Tax=Hymenobacter sp. CCM 8763 TaxID=2303334 RepID=UPI000E352B59|nr:hypothetical protein [Hymenobacter sp. CCM 8763]RFP65922.1 hypothetical protein D0N36_06880 [Hymenobacter sp. CCM 8763]
MPPLGSVRVSAQHTCLPNGAGAELRVTVRTTTSQGLDAPLLFVSVLGPNGAEYTDSFAGAAHTFRFSPVADGAYALSARDQADNEATGSYTVSCGGAGPPVPPTSCDLVLTDVVTTSATTVGGTGNFTAVLNTSAPPVTAIVTRLSDNQTEQLAPNYPAGPIEFYRVPVDAYRYVFTDAARCTATLEVTITEPAPPPPPDPNEPAPPAPAPRFVAVGGLLARPALLTTPVFTLTGAQGQPRRGLHVELELSREGSPAPFARLRKTVRQLDEQVDAAALLATLLQPGQPRSNLPVFGDNDVSQAFTYRFREVDAEAAGEWQQDAGRYVAVLAALPPLVEEDDYLAGYLSFSAFPSGQLVQQVGYGLELTAWLPGARIGEWWAELRYLDQSGSEVSIVTRPIPAYVPAGVLRVALPARPPVCAASVEFRLTDTNRAYEGTCPDGQPTTTPPPTGGPHDFNILDFTDPDFL